MIKITYLQLIQARGTLRQLGQLSADSWGSPVVTLKITKAIRLLDAEHDDFTKTITDFGNQAGFVPRPPEEVAKLSPKERKTHLAIESKVLEFQKTLMKEEVEIDFPELKLSQIYDRVSTNDLAYLEPIIVIDLE